MSDSESVAAAPHPTLGGKSLQSIERPRYKSWRKKYRKMRYRFDGSLEENKKLFKEEQKLECIAKRLREELDGLLDLCLDLNQNPAIPPELRFDVSHNHLQESTPSAVPDNVTPEEANNILHQYNSAVRSGQIPPLDLHVVRQQIDTRLAAQEVEALSALESSIPHPIPSTATIGDNSLLLSDLKGEEPTAFLTLNQEADYLHRLDTKLGDPYTHSLTTGPRTTAASDSQQEEKHYAELTPRELERRAELLNPQSQHNWLKLHTKTNLPGSNLPGDDADNESLASHDNVKPPARKRPNTTKSSSNNLAKQVGDRAVERAREGWSPSAASGVEEDEGVGDDAGGGSARKRGRDPDATYRLKGGKGGAGSGGGGKGKRKRSGEDVVGPSGAGGVEKRAKVEGE